MDLIKHKLLAGQHQGPDYTKKPVVTKNADGTIREKRRPSKTFKQNAIVWDKVDLEEKFGSEKFRRLTPKTKSQEPEAEPVSEEEEEESEKVVGKENAGMELEEDPEDTEDGSEEDSSIQERNLTKDYGDLSKMTLAQLRAVAKSEKVDVHGLNTRTEVLKALKEYEQGNS